ncbi:hypothetical protein Tsubulata_008799 [Turnera subulata]|uniref:Caffeoyl-CoA O-methyltransferase n=1 Tax=Turnera subulata TaxID=218843 RepID=A0A9Q0GA61_9ROSI|nr:hypothetical protein Tsubulata_008799 [Turnera subulata]
MGGSPHASQLMALLLKLTNAKKTIEIGVFIGYTLLLTAQSIPEDGKKANEGSYDFAFVDADKGNYLNYHERLMKLVKVGGLIVYDNTLWGGTVALPEEAVPQGKRPGRLSLMEFNKKIAADDRVDVSLVPMGDVCKENLTAMEPNKQQLSKGLLQSPELYQYVLETSVYPREPEPLKELRNATAAHPRSLMATAPDAGQLITMLLNLVNAKRTIEVGVFTGYSLLLTALSIPEDGKITAIDVDREAYEIGLPIIRKAGVEHKIEYVESEALSVLDNLVKDPGSEGSFDFAFIDADKINYLNYHERLLKLVKVGGIIVYDNTLWGGTVALPEDSTPERMRASRQLTIELNKFLAADSRVQISHAPLGDGITICRRIF